MALDRFIHFDKPDESRADVNGSLRAVIEAYIGVGGWINWSHDRWFIHLGSQNAMSSMVEVERWIEVYLSPNADNIDVITRQQDNFTNAVAEGLADRLARRFNGRREKDA